MARAQRTINPLHFEDLEPHRFEDLVRQVAYRFRSWRYLDATGRLGRDGGVDIHGVEEFSSHDATFDSEPDSENDEQIDIITEERHWTIQCKRHKVIGPKLIREIVKESVPNDQDSPYGLVIAAACDVSAETMASFRQESMKLGVREAHFWSRSHLEDMLFRPDFDHLLFAYFGISLGVRRQSQLARIRRELAIKRKLLRAFGKQSVRGDFMQDLLVRDVDDLAYPYISQVTGFFDLDFSPWHTASAEAFHVRGLWLWRFGYTGWLRADGSWDMLEETRSQQGIPLNSGDYWKSTQEDWRVGRALTIHVPEGERRHIRECWLLPYSRILEVDAVGDALHEIPHVYCRFSEDGGPYDDDILFLTTGAWREEVELDPEKRLPLFENLKNQTANVTANAIEENGTSTNLGS